MTLSGGQERFIDACTACGACREVCPFLVTCGSPGEIIRDRPDAAFFCTNCGVCRPVCPMGFDPAAALWETKRRLIARGTLPGGVARALKGARAFVRTGQRFPFLYYSSSGGAVFWPGCGLAGTCPDWVEKIRDGLEERLGEPVGIVLDCCGDPVWQMGDGETIQTVCRRIRKRLQRRGITRIVTGCRNCRKIFAAYIPEMRVDFALDLLNGSLVSDALPSEVFLHCPCPTLPGENMRRATENPLGDRLARGRQTMLVACCGNGGNLPALAPDLADRFTRRITDEAGDRSILTSCTGCAHRIQGAERRVYHLLGCLPGLSPEMPCISPLHRWINRIRLSLARRCKSGTGRLRLLARALFTPMLPLVLKPYFRRIIAGPPGGASGEK